MMADFSTTSEKIASSSNRLFSYSAESKDIYTRLESVIEEISEGSDSRVLSATESARAMEEMAAGNQRVAETSSMIAEKSLETTKEAEQGNVSIQEAIMQIEKVNESAHQSVISIKQLSDNSKEIIQIITLITEIAEQTNLLALNAAIEAARAGENGKGFAVVAEEVRKLAEQSANSAKQISHLIRALESDSSRSVDAMDKVNDEVASGITMVKDAGEAFDSILLATHQISEQIQELSAVSQQMSAGTEQVWASLDDMLKSVKDNVSNIEQLSSASKEQLQSTEKISSSAETLDRMSQELKEQTNKFVS